MSRSITFTAVYSNGVRTSTGVYNRTDAVYFYSLIKYNKVYAAMFNLSEAIKGKKVKRIEINMQASTSCSITNKIIPELSATVHPQFFDNELNMKANCYTRLINTLYIANRS